MKRSGFVVLAILGLSAAATRGAEATRPIDFTLRNTPYAPGADTKVAPDKQAPATNVSVQEKRFEGSVVEKKEAPAAGRRSAIEVSESREKKVRDKDSRRPESLDHPTSAHNQRRAAISTGSDTTKPPMVSKYQDSLVAASASNMARFPALDGATSAKINRFVFRKNPPEPAVTTDAKAITPAAGGSAVRP